jgi:cytochrome c biogenesis protein CcdA
MASLADAIRFVHLLFVVFIVGGLVAIWVGALLRRRWVRHFWFRITHLSAMVFVALQTLLGYPCPLTVWEDALDPGNQQDAGFIERYVNDLLYYDWPGWVFTLLHLGVALLIILTYWMVRPNPRPRRNPP